LICDKDREKSDTQQAFLQFFLKKEPLQSSGLQNPAQRAYHGRAKGRSQERAEQRAGLPEAGFSRLLLCSSERLHASKVRPMQPFAQNNH